MGGAGAGGVAAIVSGLAEGCVLAGCALLGGETIPLSTGVFWDDVYKHWYVDAWLAYGVTPNRPEFAGVIRRP